MVAPTLVGNGTFIEFSLSGSQGGGRAGEGFNLLGETFGALSPRGGNLNNSYGGRVLSFTTGPAKGFSARIYSDVFTSGHVFRIPTSSVSGDVITAAMVSSLDGSEVIINGRDFSGTGADVHP